MNKKQFKEYCAAFAIARCLLKNELITDEEYQKLTEVLSQKYRSVINSTGKVTDNPIPKNSKRIENTERR